MAWATMRLALKLLRSEHADVLEWLWFLNSHPETIYKLMYGDKDTFRLAFSLAGKEAAYQQARVPEPALLHLYTQNRCWICILL